MPGEMFYWVLNMSVSASLAGAVVLLVRRIRAIPRRVSAVLWAAPFVRMCVPVGVNSPYSLMSLISRFAVRTVTVWEPVDSWTVSAENFVRIADSYSPLTYKQNLWQTVFNVAAFVWASAALAILIALTTVYLATRRETADAKPIGNGIYVSDKVSGPAVYGVLRPRIVLPSGFESSDRRFELLHERAHVRRRDNLWRLIAFAAAAAHWFNPLAWVFLRCFLADIELACDESVISKLDEAQRRQYAASLLGCAEGKSLFASAFGGAKIRTRIENVISFKRMTAFSLAAFSALAVAMISALVTNAG